MILFSHNKDLVYTWRFSAIMYFGIADLISWNANKDMKK